MIERDELVKYLDEFLQCSRFKDYCPNGLQVEGHEAVKKICTAVTATQEVIDKAAALNADVLLVHHGFFFRGEPEIITGIKFKRIKALILSGINLIAYHLPLDAHPTLGNNARLCQILGIDNWQVHEAFGHDGLLWSGSLSKPITVKELSEHLTTSLKQKPLLVPAEDRMIKKIAWCTGGAPDLLIRAHELGADAYVTGEISERHWHQAKELNIHFLAAGHHATERYGVMALGEHLAALFDLDHQYLEIDNPV